MKTIRLYRGLENPWDVSYDRSRMDSPIGYSTWTDNPSLAKQYGKYVYYIDLPLDMMGDDVMDSEGNRYLFYYKDKACGLNGVCGREYLVFDDYEDYSYSANLLESMAFAGFYYEMSNGM